MGDYELYHAARRHKYIKKIGNRYFYTQEELNAYYKDSNGKKTSLGIKELNSVINRDQEAFYANNSQDADRALRQKQAAQKKYDKTILGKADKATNGLATSPYRLLRNKARSNAEQKAREVREAKDREHRAAVENANAAQEKGKAQTTRTRTQMSIKESQNRGRARTAQLSGGSKEYNEESAYNSKQNDFPKSSVTTKNDRRKRGVKSAGKHAKRSIKSLKKQASRGKKALDKWYTKSTSPSVTVTYDEAKLK